MYDAIFIIAGVNCNNDKMGGWGVSIFEIEETVLYEKPADNRYESKLVDNYYLSSNGINRQWKIAKDDYVGDTLPVLKVRDLYEHFGSTTFPSTLAKSESLGFLETAKIITERQWDNVLIFCESRYVADNLGRLIKSRDENILKRKDGANISTYDIWSEITPIALKLISKKIKLKWKWVNNELPKDMAEYSKLLAKKGQALSYNGKDIVVENFPLGRKRIPENKCHGFLLQSKMYFIPSIDNTTNSGKRYYFCGNHGKKDEWCGKPKSDSTISAFILDDLDPAIELLTAVKKNKSPNNNDGQVIKLDTIKTSGMRNEIISYHNSLLIYDEKTGNIRNYADRILLLEQRPPYLFFKLYDKIYDLYLKFNDFISGNYGNNVFSIDITDKVYNRDKKGNLTLTKDMLIKKYTTVHVEKLKVDINLTVGIELLPDLGLRRIALENPEVSLYLEQVGPVLYKYYLMVKTDKARGLFTTTDSNSIFLKSTD